jgi:hypothetical protein
MPTYPWQRFLARWSEDLLSSELARAFPPEVQASGWIGSPGATESELAGVEARLGTTLPPSYRAFLEASNGWPVVIPLLGRLWSTAQIEWLKVRHSSLIKDWITGGGLSGPPEPVPDELYFVYGEEQDSIWMRAEYLASALEISDLDPGDGAIYLLNPEVVTPEGEWEAWYLASWLPGAERFRSFWEMMQAQYEQFLAAVPAPEEVDPAYIEYVKERLRPAGAPEALAAKLPELLEMLQQAGQGYRSQVERQDGRPPMPRYGRSVVEGFEFAEQRVREIQAQAQEPQALHGKLRALADELDDLGRQGFQEAMEAFDLRRMLSAGVMRRFDQIDQQIESSGKPAGYRHAADLIRSFLGEA